MSGSDEPDVMALATDERNDLADHLDTLSPADWSAPTLCDGWTVRDVVAHIISYEDLSMVGVAARMVRARGSTDRANAIGLEPLASTGPEDLVRLLREHARPRGLTARLGGRIGLTDGVIHHQDIRRPLGAEREVPADRLRVALDMALTAPTLPSRKKVEGVTLIATDLDWSHGNGPEVTGPGEAMLLAIAGRAVALDDLDGPGLARLRSQQ